VSVRPVDLQAPLSQVDEVSRVQRAPQVASERQASGAVVQGEPEVRLRQEDVVEAPDVAAEEAENNRRRRGGRDPAPRRKSPRGVQAESAQAAEPEMPEEAVPTKGVRLDVRGL